MLDTLEAAGKILYLPALLSTYFFALQTAAKLIKSGGWSKLRVVREIRSSCSGGHLYGSECVTFHGWIPATEGPAEFVVQDLSADLQ